MVQPLWKTVRRFLKKLNIELPRDPAIPLPGMYPKELKMGIQIHTHTRMFTAALLTTARGRTRLRCALISEWETKLASPTRGDYLAVTRYVTGLENTTRSERNRTQSHGFNDSISTETSRIVKSTETEGRPWLPGAGRGRNGE